MARAKAIELVNERHSSNFDFSCGRTRNVRWLFTITQTSVENAGFDLDLMHIPIMHHTFADGSWQTLDGKHSGKARLLGYGANLKIRF